MRFFTWNSSQGHPSVFRIKDLRFVNTKKKRKMEVYILVSPASHFGNNRNAKKGKNL